MSLYQHIKNLSENEIKVLAKTLGWKYDNTTQITEHLFKLGRVLDIDDLDELLPEARKYAGPKETLMQEAGKCPPLAVINKQLGQDHDAEMDLHQDVSRRHMDRDDEEEHMYSREDVFQGGPGLSGYAYRADVYCPDCIRDVFKDKGPFTEMEFKDSEHVPQPIFFGEHEVAQHCAKCGKYLYGGNLNDEDVE